MCTHGIGGDDAAPEVKQFEQLWNGFEFIALAVYLDLAQHQAVATRPRADHIAGATPLGRIRRAVEQLAINRHHLAVTQFGNRLDPADEAGLQRVRIEQTEYPAKGVVCGNAAA